MTDCEIPDQSLNLSDSEKMSKISCPTHSVEHPDDANVNSLKTLPLEKHPPNGMTHISPDANGLVNQKRDPLPPFQIFSRNAQCYVGETVMPESVECNSAEIEEGNLCDCDKSNMKDICCISSSLHGVILDDNEPEEADIFNGIEYVVYRSEVQMPDIMRLITKDLSEPYSIYTYRYFIHNWPKLCFLAMDGAKCVGAIVCKLDLHKKMVRRGYIAMLAVDSEYRRKKIGSHLVLKAIKAMIADDCDEVVLETEITNQAALRLYENLGFVRDKRLFRYYLNGVDALRLKLWLR
ncbi:N-alpha-acetyltransferase 30-like [Mercenaria mercenaria]|uniref:N-alpha-acetyltransferase 30-like n=1 Tax=Mercenaria mercenaria TaxID=6596 RepID=UPI00234FA394|nr:N-alpha-acetyltransferase 30-like [Mercenaria mercenaria]